MPVEAADLEIVNRVVSRLLRISREANPCDRDDLLSDGALALIEASETWDGRAEIRRRYGGARAPFVATVVRRRVIDGMRSRLGRTGRRRTFEDGMVRLDNAAELGDRFGVPDQELARAETDGLLEELPAREAEIVRRTVIEGEEAAAVAGELGVSATRVYQLRDAGLERIRGERRRVPAPSYLTGREREMLERMAEGDSNIEIARRLQLSEETVKTHVKHVLAKLGARNRTHAVAIGFRRDLCS